MIKTLQLSVALIAGTMAASASAQQATANTHQSGGLTRAEVRADLELWKRAGLDAFWRGELTPDTTTPQYRAAYQEYVRLRQGTDYQDASRNSSGR